MRGAIQSLGEGRGRVLENRADKPRGGEEDADQRETGEERARHRRGGDRRSGRVLAVTRGQQRHCAKVIRAIGVAMQALVQLRRRTEQHRAEEAKCDDPGKRNLA